MHIGKTSQEKEREKGGQGLIHAQIFNCTQKWFIHLFVEGRQHTLLFHSFHNLAAEKEKSIHLAHSSYNTAVCLYSLFFGVVQFSVCDLLRHTAFIWVYYVNEALGAAATSQHLVCCYFLFALFYIFFFINVHSLLSLLMYVVCWFNGCCYFDSVLQLLFLHTTCRLAVFVNIRFTCALGAELSCTFLQSSDFLLVVVFL